MVTKNKTPTSVYASLLSRIKTAVDEKPTHEESFHLLKDIADVMEREHISIEEMCMFSGRDAYRHNKYAVSVFYLRLGECYDKDVCETYANTDMAKKYYQLSDQPPAKWRLARICRQQKGGEKTAMKLLCDSVNLLTQEDYDTRFFGKRLEYLLDIFKDLYELSPVTSNKEFSLILQWVIQNKEHVRVDHHEALCGFTEFDVECDDPELVDELYALIQ